MNQDSKIQAHQTLEDIKYLMENSSKYLSLSGLSGILAGVYALTGLGYLSWKFDINPLAANDFSFLKQLDNVGYNENAVFTLLVVACMVLIASVLTSFFMSRSSSTQQGFTKPAIRLLVNLAIPLLVGGLLIVVAIQHFEIEKIIPYSLIFFGLALINASKYTLGDIRTVGLIQIALGVMAYILPQYSILLWGFSFGIVHILYGGLMYLKYGK